MLKKKLTKLLDRPCWRKRENRNIRKGKLAIIKDETLSKEIRAMLTKEKEHYKNLKSFNNL